MKTVLFFVFIALFPAWAANASGVRIEDGALKNEYARSENVKIGVVNDGKVAVDFYANAELLSDGEWVTWPYEIEHGTTEGLSIIHHIVPGETIQIRLGFREIAPPPIPDGVTPQCDRITHFRFRVVVEGVAKQELYSKAFQVVDPYGACSEDGKFGLR